MALTDGDVIEFDYELWVEGREGLYDATMRPAAEEAGIFDSEAYYGPVVYVIGSGRIIKGLEDALRSAPSGTAQTVELAPEQAYGPRDPKNIETVPIHEFRKNEVDPQVGMTIRYRNRSGVVTTVGGGRVRVDFNPALAGKRLKYRFTIRRVVKDVGEKVAALVRMNFPAKLDWKARAIQEDGKAVVVVDVPEGVGHHPGWAEAKLRALIDVGRWTDLDQLRFVEAYSLPKRGAEKMESSASPAGSESLGA